MNALVWLQSVTWVRVDKPVFDLWGVITSSLGLAGICAGIACLLGSAVGILMIRRRRTAGIADHRLFLER